MTKYREIFELPPRIFAVGDIHGCPAELTLLMEHLKQKEQLAPQDLLIFIGDYIDRGPESKAVIDFLVALKADFPTTVFLKGNHEDMLLDFLGFEGSMGRAYLLNGGAECIKSYGLAADTRGEEVLKAIPQTHLDFLNSLERYLIVGDYVFAHAGVNPLRDLKWQLNEDLFWIRDQFINNLHHFRKTVIFGHTPYHDVLFHLPYKIGIDTGLVFGNLLTCVELRTERIFQVDRGGAEVNVHTFGAKQELVKAMGYLKS